MYYSALTIFANCIIETDRNPFVVSADLHRALELLSHGMPELQVHFGVDPSGFVWLDCPVELVSEKAL